MFKYAKVVRGEVVGTQESSNPVISDLLVRLSNEDVSTGELYSKGTFKKPSLNEAKTNALVRKFERVLDEVVDSDLMTAEQAAGMLDELRQ
jgi:hypothetical protein